MCGGIVGTSRSDGTVEERLSAALAENDRLRGDLAKRHTLSIVIPSGYATTVGGTGPVVGPFRLDDRPVEVRWTKSGLKIGCHTVTREALEALGRLEE